MTGRKNIYYIIFGLSGFSGLIYESIWSHYLKLFLGHAAYAQTFVIAIFMGGMAFGSWLSGRKSQKWRNLLYCYAAAEVLIGLSAILFHESFDLTIQYAYNNVIPLLETPYSINVFKLLLSAALITPQTILLGMTFPLMAGGIIRKFPSAPGKTVSILYFTNSLGAAIGVLVSGFWWINAFGLPGTIRIAGVINIILALTVMGLARANLIDAGISETPVNQTLGTPPERSLTHLLLAGAFFTGVASFIYEVSWLRMLSMVLGSSTHAFELMLSAFIFGLAIGSFWVNRRIEGLKNPILFLGWVQISMGLLAIMTLVVYDQTFYVMEWLLGHLGKTPSGYLQYVLSSNGICLALMLPTTFCAGMTLPLITHVMFRRNTGEKSIGYVYAANTIGAIAGIMFAVHVGMPFFGLKNLIIIGAVIDLSIGLTFLWNSYPLTRRHNIPAIATATCFLVIILSHYFFELDPYKMSAGIFRGSGTFDKSMSEILYHEDGKTATVSVVLHEEAMMSIITNGKPDASLKVTSKPYRFTYDESTQLGLALIPMAHNPAAQRIANIGLGSGLTTNTLLLNPRVERVDTIEIEEKMFEGAKYFGKRNELVFSDPRSKIHIEDAKTFFASHHNQYDIIISEPSNPWVSGVASLFSEEFYGTVSRYLRPNGLYAQWVQLYEINLDILSSIVKAMKIFDDYVIYTLDKGNILILAKKEGEIGFPQEEIFAQKRIQKVMSDTGLSSSADINFREVGRKSLLDSYFDRFEIAQNSDYFPILDQLAEKARFLNDNALAFNNFSYQYLPPSKFLYSKHSNTHTNITKSFFHLKTLAAQRAALLRDYYLEKKVTKKLPLALRQEADLLIAMFNSKERLDPDVRMQTLYNQGIRLLPYLSSLEMQLIFSQVLPDGGMQALSAKEIAWFKLFIAVSERNGSDMYRYGLDLLSTESGLPITATEFLLSTAMMGALMEGDKKGAFSLWRSFKSKRSFSRETEILFGILEANALPPNI